MVVAPYGQSEGLAGAPQATCHAAGACQDCLEQTGHGPSNRGRPSCWPAGRASPAPAPLPGTQAVDILLAAHHGPAGIAQDMSGQVPSFQSSRTSFGPWQTRHRSGNSEAGDCHPAAWGLAGAHGSVSSLSGRILSDYQAARHWADRCGPATIMNAMSKGLGQSGRSQTGCTSMA